MALGPSFPFVEGLSDVFLTFVLVPQPTFGQQAQMKLLGLWEISFWAGAHGTRQFPPEPNYGIPAREDLLDLLALVAFHPLSIKVLVPQLKVRPLGELGLALQQAILDTSNMEEKDRSLVASLNLSLERLD